MKRSALLLLLGAAVSCAPAQKPPDAGAMIASAKDLDHRFVNAFNARDVEALAATYWQSPEVVSFPPDGMGARGWDDVRRALQASLPPPGSTLELTGADHRVEGDLVLTSGTWRLRIPQPDGSTAQVDGRFSDVKAERGGKWVYLMDHASVPMAPPPPPAETSPAAEAAPAAASAP